MPSLQRQLANGALWSASQRATISLLLLGLLLFFAFAYFHHPVYVSDPQPIVSARAGELADRIDPNIADADSLAALPTLGEKRAKLIVDYRAHFHSIRPHSGPAYQRVEDLLRIKGIGVATIEQLRPFLTFPTTEPTSQTATRSTSREAD